MTSLFSVKTLSVCTPPENAAASPRLLVMLAELPVIVLLLTSRR